VKTHKFFCSFHLGDQIFTLWFLNTAAKYWPGINFSFWVPQCYFEEVAGLARKVPNLKVVTGDKPADSAECWMGQDNYYCTRSNHDRFIDFMMGFHAYLAQKYGLPEWPAKDRRELLIPSECLDPDHIFRHRDYDVLFINSEALSGQCRGVTQEGLNAIARRLGRHVNVITTHNCGSEDIQFTTQYGLKLNQLGDLASRCKVVAGVANAPYLATFNELAFDKILHWVNYSHDRVNFDDSRVLACDSMETLERTVLGLF
jgi:hypothetical protein